jgi:superfamily II DNA or RNA helicase
MSITREGQHFRLSFPYSEQLVTRVKTLPNATWDKESRSWTTAVCTQSLESLRRWFNEGLVDPSPDSLLVVAEELRTAPEAVLRTGSRSRPYIIVPSFRDDRLFSKLRALPGATWDRAAGGMVLPATATAAVLNLVERGVVADPEGILARSGTSVCFDIRSGSFTLLGDTRAQSAFDRHFPAHDVVAAWSAKGIEVGFSDPFSEEVYRGQLARGSAGVHPEGMTLELFPHQALTVAVALEREGFGVFAPPGLGKSAIGIALGVELMNREEIDRVVVICPGAVRSQWADEISKFTGESGVVVIGGSAKQRAAALALAPAARWVVVHYDVLDREFAGLKTLCSGSLVIADEIHRAKNPTAKRSKALYKLARLAHKRVGLTGTPVESSPEEWYWVHQALVPGALGSVTDFRNRYMYPSRWGFEGARNLDELRVRSAAHHIRFTKAEVAPHLPPLRVQHMPLDPDVAYAAALRRLHRSARAEIVEARKAHAASVNESLEDAEAGAEMTAVGMLRDACISPRLLHSSESTAAKILCESGAVPDVDGPKLDELRRIASELHTAGERLVVFTYSERMARLIAERLDTDAVPHVSFTGATSQADRDSARRRFVDPNDSVCVFIATDAGAEGLNLGTCCSTLVNFDIPWTPTRLEQRSNRIHRIDGTHPNYLVINLTIRGTIEEGLLRMVEAKADIADALFGENDGRSRTTGRKSYSTANAALIGAFDALADEPPEDGRF